MANIEDFAIQRDKRFLFRLVAALLIATVAGLWIAGQIAGEHSAGCAARGFGELTGQSTNATAPPR